MQVSAFLALQSSSGAAVEFVELEEAPPGTDSTPDIADGALPQPDSGVAETSYPQPAVFWQPYHAAPSYASGWYYQDVSKTTQGPFTKQQLQLWRQHLPMDLLVWFIDHNGGSSHSLELAKVLGDGRLLESWKRAQQATVCPCLISVSETCMLANLSWPALSKTSVGFTVVYVVITYLCRHFEVCNLAFVVSARFGICMSFVPACMDCTGSAQDCGPFCNNI